MNQTQSRKKLVGLEVLLEDLSKQQELRSLSLGLLTNLSACCRHFVSTLDHFARLFPENLKALFGPQHGLTLDLQDNMKETPHSLHPYYKLPIYSLYSETRRPTPEMLKGLEAICVDLQDVGVRVYTYIYTVLYLLEECARQKIKVIILDRPNPIGGNILEGTLLELPFKSFVGEHPILLRHGMTLGEMAYFFNEERKIGCELEIIKTRGFERNSSSTASTSFTFTFPWINPSPNLPTLQSALCFPGTVLLEGTNLSEGRGTTRALEFIGHPSLSNPHLFLKEFQEELGEEILEEIGPLVLRPVIFTPTFNKYQGRPCGGFQWHPLREIEEVKTWFLGQLLLKFFVLHTSYFEWASGPYEYEEKILPIDLINGGSILRQWCEDKKISCREFAKKIKQLEKKDSQLFAAKRAPYLLY